MPLTQIGRDYYWTDDDGTPLKKASPAEVQEHQAANITKTALDAAVKAPAGSAGTPVAPPASQGNINQPGPSAPTQTPEAAPPASQGAYVGSMYSPDAPAGGGGAGAGGGGDLLGTAANLLAAATTGATPPPVPTSEPNPSIATPQLPNSSGGFYAGSNNWDTAPGWTGRAEQTQREAGFDQYAPSSAEQAQPTASASPFSLPADLTAPLPATPSITQPPPPPGAAPFSSPRTLFGPGTYGRAPTGNTISGLADRLSVNQAPVDRATAPLDTAGSGQGTGQGLMNEIASLGLPPGDYTPGQLNLLRNIRGGNDAARERLDNGPANYLTEEDKRRKLDFDAEEMARANLGMSSSTAPAEEWNVNTAIEERANKNMSNSARVPAQPDLRYPDNISQAPLTPTQLEQQQRDQLGEAMRGQRAKASETFGFTQEPLIPETEGAGQHFVGGMREFARNKIASRNELAAGNFEKARELDPGIKDNRTSLGDPGLTTTEALDPVYRETQRRIRGGIGNPGILDENQSLQADVAADAAKRKRDLAQDLIQRRATGQSMDRTLAGIGVDIRNKRPLTEDQQEYHAAMQERANQRAGGGRGGAGGSAFNIARMRSEFDAMGRAADRNFQQGLHNEEMDLKREGITGANAKAKTDRAWATIDSLDRKKAAQGGKLSDPDQKRYAAAESQVYDNPAAAGPSITDPPPVYDPNGPSNDIARLNEYSQTDPMAFLKELALDYPNASPEEVRTILADRFSPGEIEELTETVGNFDLVVGGIPGIANPDVRRDGPLFWNPTQATGVTEDQVRSMRRIMGHGSRK